VRNKLKFLRVVGARPQFMQTVPLRKELLKRGHEEILVHTGQHYDDNMSKLFFKQLGLPTADINLQVGSGTHGSQTGQMLSKLDDLISKMKPDALTVDGDTNSTLAGALAGAKLQVPVVHIEAGLRSRDRRMPEEINRIVADHVSSMLCAPTKNAVENLAAEGIKDKVFFTGDLMYDCFLEYAEKANRKILSSLDLTEKHYILSTIHRAENTSDLYTLKDILKALNSLDKKVILPLHPRTKACLARGNMDYIKKFPNIAFIDPIGYLEILALLMNAAVVMTDSGGLQREAYFAQVPSIILRSSTEWVEQIESGWSILSGNSYDQITTAYCNFLVDKLKYHNIYGEGNAALKIVDAMETCLQ